MAAIDLTRIAGNIGALNALNSLTSINNQLSVHQARLATGKRLNEASDDPAGMAMATTFDVRRQGMKTVMNSLGDAKNLLATTEGGLRKIQDILVKMRNKALEAVGDTIGTTERDAVDTQLTEYASEIDDVVTQTRWNSTYLLSSGSAGTGSPADLSFLSDAYAGGTESFQLDSVTGFTGASSSDLAVDALDVSTSGSAASAVADIDAAIEDIKAAVTYVGSFSSRLTFKEEAFAVNHANTEAAFNRIMNANMAEEQVNASKFLILQQTATAMLAQANTAPQFLLSLFR